MTPRSTPRSTPRLRTTAGVVAATALVLGLTACSGSSDPGPSNTATPSSTDGSSAAPTPARKVDPLTGGGPSRRAVVAVKIDDTANGRPQRNIDKANIVYIEEVEGGLTRLVGIFHTSLPVVESVRSTRPADPELVSQYGRVGYVASGGARVPLQLLDKSYLRTSINDRGGPGFARSGDKPAPYNLSANLAVIAKRVKAAGARDVGFDWAASTSQLAGAKGGRVVSTRVGGTPVTFRYDGRTHRYVRYIDGQAQRTAAGKLITTPNVVVQFCRVETFTQDRDVLGNPNQFTHTVGKGKVAVFRDGKRLVGTWKRSARTKGTTFATSSGTPIRLRPGGAWVVLTRNGAPLA